MDTMDMFRIKMKERREELNITLKEIGDEIGVKEATVQRYESGNGIKSVPYDNIVKISKVLKCTPAYLMGWTEDKKNTEHYQQGEENAELIKKYSQLSHPNKMAVLTLIENLLSAQEK